MKKNSVSLSEENIHGLFNGAKMFRFLFKKK